MYSFFSNTPTRRGHLTSSDHLQFRPGPMALALAADPEQVTALSSHGYWRQVKGAAGSKNMALTFNQIGCDIPTFADAAGVADLIMRSSAKYDSISIVYNKFLSAISYEPAIVEVTDEFEVHWPALFTLHSLRPMPLNGALRE